MAEIAKKNGWKWLKTVGSVDNSFELLKRVETGSEWLKMVKKQFSEILHRPGVAWAVLQTSLSLIN